MKKKKFIATKRNYKSASKKTKMEEAAFNEEVIIVAEELEEGSEVTVMEDFEEGFQDDFTGEVDVTTEEDEEIILVIEDGVITEVIEDGEEPTEEVVNVEMADEVDEIVEEATEVLEDDKTNETLEAILEELASIKAEIASIKALIVGTEDLEKIIEENAVAVALSRMSNK